MQENEKKKNAWEKALICIVFVVTLAVLVCNQVIKGEDSFVTKLLGKSQAIEEVGDNFVLPVNHVVKNRQLPIYCVKTEEKKVALSFDAAWGDEDFPRIMEVLDKHNVKVTFFMTGSWVDNYPDCVKTLVEKGHDIGNHSEHHKDMATIAESQVEEELMSVHKKVKELTGQDMILFRPPYGSYNDTVIKVARANHYYPIQWNIDSLDWKNYGVSDILQRVCKSKNMGPGAIILCHNGAKYTADALEGMLTTLEQEGYQFVKISELIYKDNYHLDAMGRQFHDENENNSQ